MIFIDSTIVILQLTGGTKAEDTEEFKEAVRLAHQELQNEYDAKYVCSPKLAGIFHPSVGFFPPE